MFAFARKLFIAIFIMTSLSTHALGPQGFLQHLATIIGFCSGAYIPFFLVSENNINARRRLNDSREKNVGATLIPPTTTTSNPPARRL